MTEEAVQLRRPALVCVYAVIVIGVLVLLHSVWQLTSAPVEIGWLILVVLTIGTGWVMLVIPSAGISFSISDTFNIAAAVLFGPAAGATTAALDGLVLSYNFARSKRTAHRVLFNMAAPAIATWVAAHVFFALAGGQPALEGRWAVARLAGLLVLFGAVNYLVNTGLVAMAVSLERRLPLVPVWRNHFLGLWITYFGGVLAAIPLVMLQRLQASIAVMDLLILIVPLPIILYTTFRHAIGRVQDQMGHLGQVNRVYVAVIEALAQAIDAKDQVTHDHIRRVQTESVRLARALGITTDDQLQAIMAASLLHDVGKLAVPEHILNKPGRLTASEFEVMKRHAPAGADILSVVGFPYPVVPIVRHHHENWDGAGYPDGIAGEEIPIGARILAVVDCFDALTSHRPYRPRLPDRDALKIIVDRRGTMYDPRVVDTFVAMHEESAPQVAPAEPALTSGNAVVERPSAQPQPDRDPLDLREVFDLGRALAQTLPIPLLGECLWKHLHGLMPASAFVLYARDRDRDTLVAVHAAGEDAQTLTGATIPVGERLSGWVAAAGETIVNSDARLDLDEGDRDSSPLRSALAVPVGTDGQVIGVLSFYARQENAFADSHRRLALAAAHAAAYGGLLSFVPAQTRTPRSVSRRHSVVPDRNIWR